VTPDSLHDLFFAAAGAAGALIGLLFVAISIARERLIGPEADPIHRVRARSALGAFVNALSVSLFALTPGRALGISATWVGALGVLSVAASVLAVRRESRGARGESEGLSGLAFLVAIFVMFALQVAFGVRLITDPGASGAADDVATLVIVSCLLGIFRTWELIGGPEYGLRREVRALAEERQTDDPRMP
jgi:hypothetical protein